MKIFVSTIETERQFESDLSTFFSSDALLRNTQMRNDDGI